MRNVQIEAQSEGGIDTDEEFKTYKKSFESLKSKVSVYKVYLNDIGLASDKQAIFQYCVVVVYCSPFLKLGLSWNNLKVT